MDSSIENLLGGLLGGSGGVTPGGQVPDTASVDHTLGAFKAAAS